jgi:RNA polymerase sigma factor (sigma-70 family)
VTQSFSTDSLTITPMVMALRHGDAGALREAYPAVMAAALVRVWLADEAWHRNRTVREYHQLVRPELLPTLRTTIQRALLSNLPSSAEPLQLPDWSAQPAEELLTAETREVMEEGIQRLPEELRTVFVLRDIEGLSNSEVAEILELSVAAVKSRLHRARIEAKRLRYLLEPLRRLPSGRAAEAVAALKGLQELLGSWHDRHQARQALASALVEAAADRARSDRDASSGDLRPGLLAIDQQAAREATAIYQQLAEVYLPTRATAVLDLAYAVVAELEGPSDEAERVEPVPERKLLLTGLPAEAAGGVVEEVAQGWLPGEQEHVGMVRSAGGERFFLARPAARGATELEAISRADYEAWWPLTEGRRLSHRSHRVAALPGWRFDQFTDRRLVLAVVESGAEATPPAWLEPAVVRDVTEERGYLDEALARRAPRPR